MDRILASTAAQFYVVDEREALLGAITLGDARRVLLSPPTLARILMAEDVMRRDVPAVVPGESLSSALAKFARVNLPELPVVQADAGRRLLGTLAYADVLAVYQDEVFKADSAPALSRGVSALAGNRIEIAPGFSLAEWEPSARFHGQTLADARLPDVLGVRVLLLKRRDAAGQLATHMPHAQTVLAAGDVLVLLGPSPAIDRAVAG
jgi:hypothetical protein